MCVHARACAKARAEGGGGGREGLYTRLNTGDLWLGGGCLVGGTLACNGGTAELVAVSAFSGTLYRTNEQRSEAHFYTLLGTLPCQSFPRWHWNGFSSSASLFYPPLSSGSVSAYGSRKQNAHCRRFFFCFVFILFVMGFPSGSSAGCTLQFDHWERAPRHGCNSDSGLKMTGFHQY